MTQQQKEKLRRMRLSGKTYADIGTVLNLKESTVRTYCCRNGLTDKDIQESQPKTNVCQFCGKPLSQTPKHRPKKFCSDNCRMAWWAKHRDELLRKANYTVVCKQCGKEFISYGNKGRKFCGRDCYFAFKNGDRPQSL